MARPLVSALLSVTWRTPRPASVMMMPAPTVLVICVAPPRALRTRKEMLQPVMSLGADMVNWRIKSWLRMIRMDCSGTMHHQVQGVGRSHGEKQGFRSCHGQLELAFGGHGEGQDQSGRRRGRAEGRPH